MIDLDAIRERAKRASYYGDLATKETIKTDLPALIAEVERLRGVLERISKTDTVQTIPWRFQFEGLQDLARKALE